MWKPAGRDVGKKQGHLPLGTLLYSCDLVILGKLEAGIVCVCVCARKDHKAERRGPRVQPAAERTGPNSREPSGNVRRGGSSWVRSERERATELRVSRRTLRTACTRKETRDVETRRRDLCLGRRACKMTQLQLLRNEQG